MSQSKEQGWFWGGAAIAKDMHNFQEPQAGRNGRASTKKTPKLEVVQKILELRIMEK